MYENTSTHTASRLSLHELQYDVFIFSQDGLELAPGEDFIQSHIPYNLSLYSLERRTSSEFPESITSPTLSSYPTSLSRGEEKLGSMGYSKLFSLGFLSSINRKLDRLVNRFRVKKERSRSA